MRVGGPVIERCHRRRLFVLLANPASASCHRLAEPKMTFVSPSAGSHSRSSRRRSGASRRSTQARIRDGVSAVLVPVEHPELGRQVRPSA